MIKSLANSSITNEKKYRSMMAGSVENNADHLIAETVLGSAVSSVSFDVSSLAALGYKNLQIRMVTRSVDSQNIALTMSIILNGDSGSNYSKHALRGNGSSPFPVASAPTTPVEIGNIAGGGTVSGSFGTSILDILDFGSTVKNKTIRNITGSCSGTIPEVGIWSGAWYSLSAVTSITFSNYGANFAINSRFSLYASKG